MDHVGLSVQLEPWKDKCTERDKNLFHSVSSSFLTVPGVMAMQGAMED